MDELVYDYTELVDGNQSNRLNFVTDNGTDYGTYDDIKTGQITLNYKYDKLGQLEEDVQESMQLEWRFGDKKLSKITRTDQSSPEVEFIYNPFGVRVGKLVKPRSSGVLSPSTDWKFHYYAYDANGTLMATYTSELYTTEKLTTLDEAYIYGSEHIGQLNRDLVLYDDGAIAPSTADIVNHSIGQRRYYLKNHLGTANVTLSDRKTWNSTDNVYEPVITSYVETYMFGMIMPDRNFNTDKMRFLLHGMEQDQEVSGTGNSYTTEFRQYDPRLGRWKSLDPLMHKFPWMSPYVAFNNNPVYFVDPLGLEGGPAKEEPKALKYSVDRSFNEGEFEKKLPKSANHGDMIFFKFKDAKNPGDRSSTAYHYVSNGNWRKTQHVKGADQALVSTVSGGASDYIAMEEYLNGSNTIAYGAPSTSGKYVRGGIAPSGVTMGSSTPTDEIMGADITENSPTPNNTTSAAPSTNDLAGATGAAVTTAEIVRNAKSYEQAGALAGTVDKAVKNGEYVMNGKVYKNGYNGNTAKIAKVVKGAKVTTKVVATVGRVIPGVSVVTSSVEFFTGDMTAEDQVQYGMDLAMTALAVCLPGVGTAISAAYFVARIFWE